MSEAAYNEEYCDYEYDYFSLYDADLFGMYDDDESDFYYTSPYDYEYVYSPFVTRTTCAACEEALQSAQTSSGVAPLCPTCLPYREEYEEYVARKKAAEVYADEETGVYCLNCGVKDWECLCYMPPLTFDLIEAHDDDWLAQFCERPSEEVHRLGVMIAKRYGYSYF